MTSENRRSGPFSSLFRPVTRPYLLMTLTDKILHLISTLQVAAVYKTLFRVERPRPIN